MGDPAAQLDVGLTWDFLRTVFVPHYGDKLKIIEYKVKKGSNKTDNYLSVIYAVRVVLRATATSEDQVHHLVVKRLPPDPSRKEMMQKNMLFKKEYQVYSVLLPAMTEFQRKLGLKDSEITMPATPKCYYGSDDAVVLEDIRLSGFRMTDKMSGMDAAHCALALQELAKFHAISFAMKNELVNEEKDLVSRFPFLKETIYLKNDAYLHALMESCFTAATEIVRNSAQHRYLLPSMLRFRGTVYDKFTSYLNIDSKWSVICHGDYWVNNLLFKYNEENVPTAAKLLDLQLVCYTPLATDLIFLFYSSTTGAVRRDSLQSLLCVYHEAFCKAIHQMGLHYPEFTLETLKQEFENALPFAFLTAVYNVPLILEDSIDLDNVAYVEKEDFRQQMEQMVAISQNNERVRLRILEMVDEMVDNGIL